MNLRTLAPAAALAAAALLAGCSGTETTGLWKDPTKQVVYKKILVAVMGVDMSARRNAEEVMVKRLPPGVGIASYQVVPAGEERDLEKLKVILREASFDGVLVVRLMGVDTEVTTTAMAGTYSMYGYYGYTSTAVYARPMLDVKKIAKVEAKLFDVVDEKPVFAMTTETQDPTKKQVVIEEVTEQILQRLGESGFLGAKKK